MKKNKRRKNKKRYTIESKRGTAQAVAIEVFGTLYFCVGDHKKAMAVQES